MNWLNSVYTDGSDAFISNNSPKKGEEIEISIRILKNNELTNVMLKTKLNGAFYLSDMKKYKEVNNLCYYKTKIKCYENELAYQFYLVTKERIYYYTAKGITTYIQGEANNFRLLYDYMQPSWVKGAVFYQIFPDRFFNGNKDNDVKAGEYTFDGHKTIHVDDFNSIPKEYKDAHCLDFYGGDLEGILQKLDYLEELGVTVLYLNPIFSAATVHHYDCLDFFTVDPHFGGDEALIKLTNELHKRGMKIILDVSINHTGTANKWFNKEGAFYPLSIGAYNNKNSKEREYYFFDENNNYKCWFNVPTLPTLNYTSNALRDIIYKGNDSFIKKFLRKPFSIDGWRFDVADVMARNDMLQLHHEIWPEIRKSIKEENPEALILAEDWSECSEFFNGNEWDSTMNYFGCSTVIREFILGMDLVNERNPILKNVKAKMSGEDFINKIKEFLNRIPLQIQENMFNLINSHDVPRLHNDENTDDLAIKLAITVMFTLIGAPSIYYGDEVSLAGRINSNEGCRYPMSFNEEAKKGNRYSLYQYLSKLKVESKALSNGGLKFLNTFGRVFSYARIYDLDTIIVIASMEDNDILLELDINSLGYNKLPAKDLYGNSIIYDGKCILVKARETYLIKL